jgi:cytidine deaminase
MNTVEDNIEECNKYIDKCYSPYSNFNVVAMLVCKDRNYIGVNVENCSYSLTVCAEANCISSAITAGVDFNDALYMIVYTNTAVEVTPCGSCRQFIAEFLPGDFEVYTMGNNKKRKSYKVQELIPYTFIK